MLILEKLDVYRSKRIEEKFEICVIVLFIICSCTLIMTLGPALSESIRLMHLPVSLRISGSHSLRNNSFISYFRFQRAFQRRMTSSQAAAVRCLLNQIHLFNQFCHLVWFERFHLGQVPSLHRRCLA